MLMINDLGPKCANLLHLMLKKRHSDSVCKLTCKTLTTKIIDMKCKSRPRLSLLRHWSPHLCFQDVQAKNKTTLLISSPAFSECLRNYKIKSTKLNMFLLRNQSSLLCLENLLNLQFRTDFEDCLELKLWSRYLGLDTCFWILGKSLP